MKIVESTTRTSNLNFAELVPGTVYKSTSGFYYMKVTGESAVNINMGDGTLYGKNYFVGSSFLPVNAELVIK